MNYREWNTQWNNWALVRASHTMAITGLLRNQAPLYVTQIEFFSLSSFSICEMSLKRVCKWGVGEPSWIFCSLVLTFYRVTLFFAAVPRKWTVHYWTPKTKNHDNLQCLRNLYHYTIGSFINHYVIIANNNVLLLIK